MKRFGFLLVLCFIFLLAVSGCAPAPTPAASSPTPPPTQEAPEPPSEPAAPAAEPTAEPTAAVPAEGPVVLTIAGLEEEVTLTLEELKALPAAVGQAGTISSAGYITVPASFKGVLLSDLVDLVGGIAPDLGVSVVASDGYAMTLSYDQITNGTFITYDPSDGSEKEIEDPLQVIVAYEVDGQPLDARSDGVLRLAIISEKNNQITDGHWSVKWVERIELHSLGEEWSLSLDGIRDEVVDRNSFQSCGAVACHQSTWTDDEGQVWSGVPLYLLAGRMDDEISHDGPAFNRELSKAGYQIELVAEDGYTATVDSAAAYYNRDILVANQVNDAPLPDKYFPLRLVGEGLEGSQRVGALAEIRLILEEAGEIAAEAAAEPAEEAAEEAEEPAAEAAAPPEGATLWISGKTASSLALNDAILHSLNVVQINTEHPKKGPQDYEGVYLNVLLDLASPQAGASKLNLTATDGYTSSLDLAAVRACQECLLAFTETEGAYNLVMPGFESSAWAKDLFTIIVE